MAIYSYLGQDANGKNVSGKTTALDENDLYDRLKATGVQVVSSREVKDSLKEYHLPIPVVSDYCQQLATMLKAGISLVRSLNILADSDGLKPKYKTIYENVIAMICEGTALSDAMEKQGAAFPDLLINMVRSAEASGTLDTTMARMGVYYEKQNKLKKKISSSLVYPKLLVVIVILATVAIIAFIVPQFGPVFDMLTELPLPTRILLGISDFLKDNWVILLGVLIFVVLVVRVLLKIYEVQLFMDKMKLRLPIFGKLYRKIYTARFANTLSSMYTSGLSITTSLQVSKNTIGNVYIASQFDGAIASVKAGNTLSSAVSTIDGFEKKLSSVMFIGEESGNLDEMLNIISERLDYEAEAATEAMVAVIEPCIIIFMAVVVGFIMISVMLPIFQMYSSIEQSGAA